MKKYAGLPVSTGIRAGKYCQSVREVNPDARTKLEQSGYTCKKVDADLGGLVKRWECCRDEK